MCILHSGSRVIRHRSFWNWFLFLKGENVSLFSQLSWKLCNFFIPTNLLSACCTSQETQETHCWDFQVVHRWRWSPSLVLEQFLSPCTWYYSCTWYYLVPIKKQLKTLFPWSGGQIRRVTLYLSNQSVLPMWRRPFPSNFGFPHLQQLSMIAKMTKNNYLNACNAHFYHFCRQQNHWQIIARWKTHRTRMHFQKEFSPSLLRNCDNCNDRRNNWKHFSPRRNHRRSTEVLETETAPI